MVPSWNFTVRLTSFKAPTGPADWPNDGPKIIVLTVGSAMPRAAQSRLNSRRFSISNPTHSQFYQLTDRRGTYAAPLSRSRSSSVIFCDFLRRIDEMHSLHT